MARFLPLPSIGMQAHASFAGSAARAGKQGVQLLELSAATGMLGPVTVSAMAREQVNALGIRTFTVEQSLRWPATFQDPGRMATALPGVEGVNDQANHLSIRGNSPNANAWLLEGAEIVNPNHTGNANTSRANRWIATGSTLAGSTLAGSTPAGSTPTGSTPAGSTPAESPLTAPTRAS